MDDIREYSSPAERAEQRILDKAAAAKRTQIAVAMIRYDNMPLSARDIAKEFSMAAINQAVKGLELEYPLSDEQWGVVHQTLIDARRAQQEKILSGEVPYCPPAKKAVDRGMSFA